MRLPHRETQDWNRRTVNWPPDFLGQVHSGDWVVEGGDGTEEYHDAIGADAVEASNCNQRSCSTCDKSQPGVVAVFMAAIRAEQPKDGNHAESAPNVFHLGWL